MTKMTFQSPVGASTSKLTRNFVDEDEDKI